MTMHTGFTSTRVVFSSVIESDKVKVMRKNKLPYVNDQEPLFSQSVTSIL